jgi:glycine dehydrogenase
MANSVGSFQRRHIGPNQSEQAQMLEFLKVKSLEDLIYETIPDDIRQKKDLDLPAPLSEAQVLEKAKHYASQNKIFKSYIGMGYYGTYTPSVIQRCILENPGWYTAYTPYQPEISQGRLEALINFQTMVQDITGMEIANASLLDEGTALAEAVTMAHQIAKQKKNRVFVLNPIFPQSLSVLETRCEPVGIEIETGDRLPENLDDYLCTVIQYPNGMGSVENVQDAIQSSSQASTLTLVVADLMALCLLKTPGELGADIVVGTTQRFGIPMGFGGPHAAYLATKDEFKRLIPGRIVGVSKDSKDRPAYRLALQTREQHIRREKATSNICTAQVLLAVMAGMYAVYHGAEGLKNIAQNIYSKAHRLAQSLKKAGFELSSHAFFDTVALKMNKDQSALLKSQAESQSINLNFFNDGWVSLSIDETTSEEDLQKLLDLFSTLSGQSIPLSSEQLDSLSPSQMRQSDFLTHPVFNQYQSETELMRYIQQLEKKDLTLADAMIPLGSCTMKLNAATELMPITWPEFANLHPFCPLEQAEGTLTLINELRVYLAEITGFADVSLQPNAGSQGEYAGLLSIRKYHLHRGQPERNICLIPSSAHGTNPASAVMAGMKVVIIKCDEKGNIDLIDLKEKAHDHKNTLAALMITYPSTHGVFESEIRTICEVVHDCGGQVYMDGANLNAMVGLCQPGQFGPDVCHLNLHKTFCIPHGGGGPGVGPIGVAEHLKPFMPNHNLVALAGPETGASNISAAPWGSALILPIPWAFILMMGSEGLKKATEVAILNANYIAARLKDHYPILYTGSLGRIAHECIIDLRPIKETCGITVDDIAKRLMDYGFHAPTMSWPVINTMMIEPTESEGLREIDRFCDAMIAIRNEVAKVESGQWTREDNPLVNAPHTVEDLMQEWTRSYSRQQAYYPLDGMEARKFWPSVNRIDHAYGDRNLFCSCIPVSDYNS